MSHVRRFQFIVLSVVSLLFAVDSHASVQFQPVSQEELKMTSEPNAPGAPAVILYREVNRNDYGRTGHGGSVLVGGMSDRFEEDYLRIKILTEEGRKYGNVEIPFPTEVGTITNINARTIEPDGSIKNFDGKIFDRTIVKTKGFQYQAKTFVLPDVQVGSVIEYYYTIVYNEGFIVFSRWILSEDLFTKQAKFTLQRYQNGYTPLSFRWYEHLPPGTPSPKELPNGLIQLEAANIPAFHAEDFMPPANELKSRVDFVYSLDPFEDDAAKFWRKVGKKRNEQLESFISKRGPLEQALQQIVAPTDSPDVKLHKIYSRVQQLRNTDFEPKKTESEQKRENHRTDERAEDIWNQGYGTRAQLNWLFLAFVRAAGIEADGVWVSDRQNYFFDQRSMQSGKLDRNIILVKLNGKDLYLEPGVLFTPFGMLPWEETGVQGLRLDKDGGSWIQTDVPESSASLIQRKANLKLSEDGSLEGKLIVTYTGLEALSRRLDERNDDAAARKIYLENEVRQYVPVASEIDLTGRPEWTKSDLPLVAEFNVSITGWASIAGHRSLFPVGLFGGPERHIFEYSERVHPIYFDFLSEKLDDIIVELPSGWQVTSVPKAQNQDFHVVSYALGVENGKGSLHLTRKLDINTLTMDTKYYTPLRSFYQIVKAGDEQQIVLVPSSTVSAN